MPRRKPLVAFTAGVLVFCVGLQSARADLFGGDLPLLSAIVANTAEQLSKLRDTLSTLRKTYEDTKRVAGYADDAYRAYQHFSRYTAQMFREDITSSLDAAFPDMAYFRREAAKSGQWAQGSGEFTRLFTYCVLGASRTGCVQLQEAISLKQARSSLAAVFGPAPAVAGHGEMKFVDDEAVLAVSAASAQMGRNQVARAQAEGLRHQCSDSGDAGNIAACQAAANVAQIQTLKQTSELTDQPAESNHLQALRLAQENAKRKRDISEAVERRQVILDGAENMQPGPVRLKTEGLNIFDEP